MHWSAREKGVKGVTMGASAPLGAPTLGWEAVFLV